MIRIIRAEISVNLGYGGDYKYKDYFKIEHLGDLLDYVSVIFDQGADIRILNIVFGGGYEDE